MNTRRDFIKLVGASAGACLMTPARVQAGSIDIPTEAPYRVGEWLPSDERFLAEWLTAQIERAEANLQPLHPEVQRLQDLIETDPALYMLFSQMFKQVPARFHKTPLGDPQIRDYNTALVLISQVMTTAPEYNRKGLVGFPINAILNWAMGTEAGFAAFLNEKVNAQFKRILDAWGQFLSSPDSLYVLNDDPRQGWLGRRALADMPDFVENFVCDSALPHYGFKSWDDFFTRQFRPGIRPVADLYDDAVIVNGCESAPFKVARNVQKRNRFWIKAQPYSLEHMLAGDDWVDQFVGGTVYQAFLSALSYHRWHSPVTGTILKTYHIPGTYYSEPMAQGFDVSAPNNSQGYLAEVATRSVIFMEADNPEIGLMAIMHIGMAEVSTCEITVTVGQRVTKGDQLGMFHFGGSTYCMIFRPQTRLKFDLRGQKPGVKAKNIPLNSLIARVG
jgi:phosphatidylserine decarboxylase